jgi:ribonuclease G
MKEYVINVSPLETRIALVDNKRLVELTIERQEERSVVGNIYKGRVDSIVPGIQAAFVDIGVGKNGFLYVSDIAGSEGTGDFDIDEGENLSRSRARRGPRPSIEKILKKNQSVMVQVQKDTMGTKGVRLTNFVTLPGRYVVLMPTVQQLGVSRKIEDERERDRLKGILRSFRRNRDFGLIVRTAGEGKSKSEIQADVRYLRKSWDRIKRKMERSGDAELLHEDMGPVLRAVRDTFTDDIDRLTIDNEAEHNRVTHFLDSYAPQLKKRCRIYQGKRPLFDKQGIEEEIEKAIRRKVFLKSGGHICIDQTEALIAIDVNTGKFTGKKRLEDTVFKTNMEAAEEIARQIRLRDMGGIIVVDFIDMGLVENQRKLFRKCEESVRADRAKTSVSDVSELGMIEMTRKRVKHNLVKALSQPCPYCEGAGLIRSVSTVTSDTLRRLQSLFCQTREKKVVVQVHPDISRRLRNENNNLLQDIAKQFGREIKVESVSDFHIQDVKVLSERTRKELVASGKSG